MEDALRRVFADFLSLAPLDALLVLHVANGGSLTTFRDLAAETQRKLVAAAPDLYAALRDCVTKMCEYCRKEARYSLPGRTCESGCAVMLAAKAALEKAGGAA